MKKVLTSLLVLALVGAFVAGCAPAAESGTTAGAGATTEKPTDGE